MKVNGKDVLETYGLKQWNVEMAYGEIGNESSWEDGCPVPVLLESNFGLKKIKVSVLAKGENRDEIWGKTGKLLAEMAKPAVLELDGFSHHFKTVLTNAQQVENSMNRFHKATLELVGYEYGEHKVVDIQVASSQTENVSVENNGTLPSPAVITVTNTRAIENEVVIGYLEEGHSSNIAKFSFADSIEQLKFDARTGEIWEKQMAGELERAATLEQIEVYQLPVIRCGTEKLCAWINGSTAEADISIAFDEMYL